jgi:hypothetical protein
MNTMNISGPNVSARLNDGESLKAIETLLRCNGEVP